MCESFKITHSVNLIRTELQITNKTYLRNKCI